ncbi:kinase-like domain-containing protein [Gigaspora rosea]|uniref:Kinase-like domain-containing protein n=1 Tax=Gigaspora rosea TaxID=44941 RepID=A0A397W330_9GLOM|nr:kinase-like domain-containing protein [Gigaspora rosea]
MSDDKPEKIKVEIETTPEYFDKVMSAVNSVRSNSIVRIIGETFKPVIPMLESALALIDEIIQIFERAQCNKNICKLLKDRVIAAEAVIKILQQRVENGEKLDKTYQEAFLRFKNSLENIKIYTEQVSQIQGIKRYLNANEIRENFFRLTEEYDACMNDLHFTMIVSYEEQRRIDHKYLEADITIMKEFLEKIQTIFDENFKFLSHEVNIRNPDSRGYKYNPDVKVHEIDSAMIKDPACGSESDRRGEVVKRILKNGAEIGCESFKIPTDKDAKKAYETSLRYLPILEKLGESTNILKFYGLSKLDGRDVMVFEWAELGSLKKIYEKSPISWQTKANLAYGICSGIVFLQALRIFHHDLRCENIMITRAFEAKIANFQYSRLHDQNSTNISKNYMDFLNWMAPEKMQKYKKKMGSIPSEADAGLFPYTQKCEIFSFGMLLWELTYQKVPYEDDLMQSIIDKITAGKREECKVFSGLEYENDNIQNNLISIIKKAWEHNPDVRISLEQLYIDVSNLSKKVVPGKDPAILTINNISDESHSKPLSEEEPELDDCYITDYSDFEQILLVEEGLKLHKTGDKQNRKKAWECFEANAELGNVSAIYWKGYYLHEGYYIDNRTDEQKRCDIEEATKLYKIAADKNHPDAQLRYACILPRVKENREEFLKYLTLAADNGNSVAMYTLADMYLNGKVVPKDSVKGERYLKLSADSKNEKAVTLAQKLGIKVF